MRSSCIVVVVVAVAGACSSKSATAGYESAPLGVGRLDIQNVVGNTFIATDGDPTGRIACTFSSAGLACRRFDASSILLERTGGAPVVATFDHGEIELASALDGSPVRSSIAGPRLRSAVMLGDGTVVGCDPGGALIHFPPSGSAIEVNRGWACHVTGDAVVMGVGPLMAGDRIVHARAADVVARGTSAFADIPGTERSSLGRVCASANLIGLVVVPHAPGAASRVVRIDRAGAVTSGPALGPERDLHCGDDLVVHVAVTASVSMIDGVVCDRSRCAAPLRHRIAERLNYTRTALLGDELFAVGTGIDEPHPLVVNAIRPAQYVEWSHPMKDVMSDLEVRSLRDAAIVTSLGRLVMFDRAGTLVVPRVIHTEKAR